MTRYLSLVLVGLLAFTGCVTKRPQHLTPIPLNPSMVVHNRSVMRPMLTVTSTTILPDCLWNGVASVSLAWCPCSDSTTMGYEIYWTQGGNTNWVPSVYTATNPCSPLVYGTNFFRHYTNMVDVGNSTTGTIGGLLPGKLYSFAVVAYDSTGLNSPYSEELEYTIPPYRTLTNDLSLTVANTFTNIVTLTAHVQSTNSLSVMATSNLLGGWSVLATNVTADTDGNVSYTDTNVNRPIRFYRMLNTSSTMPFTIGIKTYQVNDALLTSKACPNNHIQVLYSVSKTNWNVLTTNVVADAYGNIMFHDITTNLTRTYRLKVLQ